jgi:hypothetical protein
MLQPKFDVFKKRIVRPRKTITFGRDVSRSKFAALPLKRSVTQHQRSFDWSQFWAADVEALQMRIVRAVVLRQVNRFHSGDLHRRAFLGSIGGLVLSSAHALPLTLANAQASTEVDGIEAAIESMWLLQKSVRAHGQLRAQVNISNPARGPKQGYIWSACRNADGVIVDEEKFHLFLPPRERSTLKFTSEVGGLKGASMFEVRTGTAQKVEPFDVV